LARWKLSGYHRMQRRLEELSRARRIAYRSELHFPLVCEMVRFPCVFIVVTVISIAIDGFHSADFLQICMLETPASNFINYGADLRRHEIVKATFIRKCVIQFFAQTFTYVSIKVLMRNVNCNLRRIGNGIAHDWDWAI